MNRAQQPRPAASANANVGTPAATQKKHDHELRYNGGGKWARIGMVTFFALVALLILALTGNFVWNSATPQSKYLNKNEYQAVFVNVNGTSGGQVYFGHIQSLTDQYIDLTNVFYIQNQSTGTASSSTSSSYTLVKLGCELHGPEDQMIINNSQVYFWENLKPSGQVSQKIAQYYKQNPNGQNCSQSSSSSSTTQSNATTQSSTNTSNAATTPSSTSSSTSSKKQ